MIQHRAEILDNLTELKDVTKETFGKEFVMMLQSSIFTPLMAKDTPGMNTFPQREGDGQEPGDYQLHLLNPNFKEVQDVIMMRAKLLEAH